MLCKNTNSSPNKFHIDTDPGQPPTVYEVPPGGVVDIPDGYCKPYKGAGNRDMPPIIKMIAPGMKPLGTRAAGIVATVGPVSGGDNAVSNSEVLRRMVAMADRMEKLETENRRLRGATARRASSSPVPVVTEGDEAEGGIDVEAEAEGEADEETADAKPARAQAKAAARGKAKAAEG